MSYIHLEKFSKLLYINFVKFRINTCYNYNKDDVITGSARERKGRLEQINFGRKEKIIPSKFLSDIN